MDGSVAKPVEDEGFTIAQTGRRMFDRNIVHCAARRKEVQLVLYDEDDEIVGFFAGLDSEFVQVCRTDDQTLEHIRIEAIDRWKETGHSLDEYEAKGSLPGYVIQRIRKKTATFVKKAEEIINGRPARRG